MSGLRYLTAALMLLIVPAALGAGAIGFEDARHLLNRTSFAANVDDIGGFSGLTREQAADRLLAASASAAPAPAWAADFVSPRRVRAMGEEERRAFLRDQRAKGVELRAWWLSGMLATPAPLTEKMVLFWHNHFVSSLQKVRWPASMYRQHLLLRRHALGNFGEFLHDIARDPAMVVYLDSASNRKGQPNENFAREVMELFTLGEGHYGEHDVKEAARAFTGWSIDLDSGEFTFRAAAHDDGVKTVLGHSGNLDGDAVLDILLAHPQTAEFIVAKLWREFVSPQPDAAEVKRLAGVFRATRYSIRAVVRALLVSDAFYAPQNRAALIKSPVDLLVGTLRQFGFAVVDPAPVVIASRRLGQDLFAPPNVKGWAGGEAWINSATLLARKELLQQMFPALDAPAAQAMTPGPATLAAGAGPGASAPDRAMRAMGETRFDADRWLAQFDGSDAPVVRVILAADPVNARRAGLQGGEWLRQLVLDPVYQLK